MSQAKHKYVNGRTKDKDIFSDDLNEIGIDNEATGNWILIIIFLLPVIILILSNINYNSLGINVEGTYDTISENIYFQIICFGFIAIMLLLYFVDFIKNSLKLKKDKWQKDINKRLPRFIIWVIMVSIVIFFYYKNISSSLSNVNIADSTTTIIAVCTISLVAIVFLGNWAFKSDLYEGLGEKSETYKYNANDYDVTYHDSVEDLIAQNTVTGVTRVVDENGKLVELKRPIEKTPPYFNSPSMYKYGLAAYVPNYTDSVYLSKTHGIHKENEEHEFKIPNYPSSNLKYENTEL